MDEVSQMLLTQIAEEALGVLGGFIFLSSWFLQAWESRREGSPVVSVRFFMLRSVASALLTFEGIRAGSFSVALVMFATLILMLYNIYLHWNDQNLDDAY